MGIEFSAPYNQPDAVGSIDHTLSDLPDRRIIAFHNPFSTSSHAARKRIDALDQHFRDQGIKASPIKRIETAATRDETIDRIATLVTDDDIVLIASGDGSVSNVVQGAIHLKKRNAVMTAGGGDADDIHKGLNAPHYRNDLWGILSRGQVGQLRPVDVMLTSPDGEQRKLQPLAYFSLGFTGIASLRIDDRAYRARNKELAKKNFSQARRMIHASPVILKALSDSQDFIIHDEKDKSSRAIGEFVFANGPRMAKIARFPLDLITDGAVQLELPKANLTQVARGLGRAAYGKTRSLQDGQENGFVFEPFQVGQEERVFIVEGRGNIIAQADGEPHVLESGTEVRIRLSDQTASVMTTRKQK